MRNTRQISTLVLVFVVALMAALGGLWYWKNNIMKDLEKANFISPSEGQLKDFSLTLDADIVEEMSNTLDQSVTPTP